MKTKIEIEVLSTEKKTPVWSSSMENKAQHAPVSDVCLYSSGIENNDPYRESRFNGIQQKSVCPFCQRVPKKPEMCGSCKVKYCKHHLALRVLKRLKCMSCKNPFQREHYIDSGFSQIKDCLSEGDSVDEDSIVKRKKSCDLMKEVCEREEVTRISQKDLKEYVEKKIKRAKVVLNRMNGGMSVIESMYQEEESQEDEMSESLKEEGDLEEEKHAQEDKEDEQEKEDEKEKKDEPEKEDKEEKEYEEGREETKFFNYDESEENEDTISQSSDLHDSEIEKSPLEENKEDSTKSHTQNNTMISKDNLKSLEESYSSFDSEITLKDSTTDSVKSWKSESSIGSDYDYGMRRVSCFGCIMITFAIIILLFIFIGLLSGVYDDFKKNSQRRRNFIPDFPRDPVNITIQNSTKYCTKIEYKAIKENTTYFKSYLPEICKLNFTNTYEFNPIKTIANLSQLKYPIIPDPTKNSTEYRPSSVISWAAQNNTDPIQCSSNVRDFFKITSYSITDLETGLHQFRNSSQDLINKHRRLTIETEAYKNPLREVMIKLYPDTNKYPNLTLTKTTQDTTPTKSLFQTYLHHLPKSLPTSPQPPSSTPSSPSTPPSPPPVQNSSSFLTSLWNTTKPYAEPFFLKLALAFTYSVY